jgi:hypothetical protein
MTLNINGKVPPIGLGWSSPGAVGVTSRSRSNDPNRTLPNKCGCWSIRTAPRRNASGWGLNHLNPHTPAARYGAFPLDEARRITRKLEFHYTPKQGRWLNRAGCELAVLAGQCLARRLSTIDPLREDIAAWEGPRHQRQTKIHWQFGTEVARVKLKRLYPSVESTEDSVGPEAS